MRVPEEAVLLRIFLGEDDRVGSRPLHEHLVLLAREHGLAGATVLRGSLGYGRSSRLHHEGVLRLSSDLPMVVEIVDREEAIAAFLPALEALHASMLVTIEKVRVLRDGPGAEAK
jgi:PII-like signaling protein